jgi:O-methyltransferase involved in polyketide biosynthesis
MHAGAATIVFVSSEPRLPGIAETALWTLWLRSSEARRRDGVLVDPLAIDLVEHLDYPFAQRFGRSTAAHQIQGLRACVFDRAIKHFLAEHPAGTVVALGEGLETQRWRVDNGEVHWLTVDLPEVTALRQALLPLSARQQTFSGSVLDTAWMDLVEPRCAVIITAQGLLMYLKPEQVHDLIAQIAKRFPDATLVFDALPARVANVARRVMADVMPYVAWTVEPKDLLALKALDPSIAQVRELFAERGRGIVGRLAPSIRHIPVLRGIRPMVIAMRFTAASPAETSPTDGLPPGTTDQPVAGISCLRDTATSGDGGR